MVAVVGGKLEPAFKLRSSVVLPACFPSLAGQERLDFLSTAEEDAPGIDTAPPFPLRAETKERIKRGTRPARGRRKRRVKAMRCGRSADDEGGDVVSCQNRRARFRDWTVLLPG